MSSDHPRYTTSPPPVATHVPRVIVAAAMHSKSRAVETLAKVAADAVNGAGLSLVRSIVVKAERQPIQQLILHVANDNGADVILILGGTGFGRHDDTCEAIDSLVDRRIEGFGDAYRRMLEPELGARSFLARASAGVYNQCLVFAMTGRETDVKHAMESLILPTLQQAVDLATGRARAGDGRN